MAEWLVWRMGRDSRQWKEIRAWTPLLAARRARSFESLSRLVIRLTFRPVAARRRLGDVSVLPELGGGG